MDKLLVRILPILLNLYIIVVTLFAINGIDVSVYDYWFSPSIMMGILLSVLAHSQGRYHCKWIRALCYNLIFVPAISYIDAIYPLFYSGETFVIALISDVFITIFATIILAINHFRKARKVTKSRYEELRPIKCNCQRKNR